MRYNMTVRVSYDEGSSWRYSRPVHDAPLRAYYSDLARLSDGTVVLLYGCDGDEASSPRRVAAATFNLAWLTRGRDSGADPGIHQRHVDLSQRSGIRAVSGGTAAVVHDIAARNQKRVDYSPTTTDDHIEYAFTVPQRGSYELWLRVYRTQSGGLVAITVDGEPTRTTAVDLAAVYLDGYDSVLLGTRELRAGSHSIRFTLSGDGIKGGRTVSLDDLNLVTAATAPDVPTEVVVDNNDLGFETVGAWTASTTSAGYYGSNYVFHVAGDGGAVARWHPVIPGDDRYEVLVSDPALDNRAPDAPYAVHHADGTTVVAVDQTQPGQPDIRTGDWVSIGTFRFAAGTGAYVDLSNKATRLVVADAVRLRRAP